MFLMFLAILVYEKLLAIPLDISEDTFLFSVVISSPNLSYKGLLNLESVVKKLRICSRTREKCNSYIEKNLPCK